MRTVFLLDLRRRVPYVSQTWGLNIFSQWLHLFTQSLVLRLITIIYLLGVSCSLIDGTKASFIHTHPLRRTHHRRTLLYLVSCLMLNFNRFWRSIYSQFCDYKYRQNQVFDIGLILTAFSQITTVHLPATHGITLEHGLRGLQQMEMLCSKPEEKHAYKDPTSSVGTGTLYDRSKLSTPENLIFIAFLHII